MISYRLLELHASSYLIGGFGALYALFPLILAIPLGHWVNQFGEGKFVALGTFLIVLSTLGLMWAHDTFLMIAFVLCLGSAQFLCMVGAQAMFGNRSPSGNYEKFFGYYTFSAALGQVIGPAIGSWASGSRGLLPRSTTHGFFAAAILALLGLLIVLPWFAYEPTISMSAKSSKADMSMRSVLSNPGMKVAMFTSMSIASSIDVLVVFLPVFGKERGFTSGTVAFMLVARAASSMVSRFFLGAMTELIGYKRLLILSIGISSAACIGAALTRDSNQLMAIMVVAGFALGIGQPMTMAWVSRKSKENERSFAISIRLASNRLGQFMLPGIAGVLAAPLGAGAVFIALALLIGSSGPLVATHME